MIDKSNIISVIITTYNNPDYLTVVLDSLMGQTDQNFEIIVADDGSDYDFISFIKPYLNQNLTLRYVRQDHQGFRVARLRNLALKNAKGSYVIFIDGDCACLKDFIAIHRKLAETGHFVSGKRSFLGSKITKYSLSCGRLPRGGRLSWLLRGLMAQCTRPLEFFKRGEGKWRYTRSNDWEGVQTCNLGVFAKDIQAINGFDNRFQGHGLEDSDFVFRLIASKVRRKLGNHSSFVLHLKHGRLSRPPESPNATLFEETQRRKDVRSVSGLEQLNPQDTAS